MCITSLKAAILIAHNCSSSTYAYTLISSRKQNFEQNAYRTAMAVKGQLLISRSPALWHIGWLHLQNAGTERHPPVPKDTQVRLVRENNFQAAAEVGGTLTVSGGDWPNWQVAASQVWSCRGRKGLSGWGCPAGGALAVVLGGPCCWSRW